MEKDSLVKVTFFIENISLNSEFNLIDIEHSNNSGSTRLVIFIDKEGGVDLDDCVKFNELVNESGKLDEIIDASYTLEVSSPGPKRPLKDLSDYVRFKGKKVKVKLLRPAEGTSKKVFIGTIEEVVDNRISINDSGKIFFVLYENILKANLNL